MVARTSKADLDEGWMRMRYSISHCFPGDPVKLGRLVRGHRHLPVMMETTINSMFMRSCFGQPVEGTNQSFTLQLRGEEPARYFPGNINAAINQADNFACVVQSSV